MSDIFYYKNEDMVANKLGITTNKIAKISDFLTEEEIEKVKSYLEDQAHKWGETSFDSSYGISLLESDSLLLKYDLPIDFFSDIQKRLKKAVEKVFNHQILDSKCHAQRWIEGAFAYPHSDNSDHEGNLSEFSDMKYASILYINSEYVGGEIYFPEHIIDIKPATNDLIIFPGGYENIHGVREITSGVRYTLMAFWDF